MGNSHKQHHFKKKGGQLPTKAPVVEEEVEVEEEVSDTEEEPAPAPAPVKAPVKATAPAKPAPAKPAPAKPADAPADAAPADAPADGKCCPCPDEKQGLLANLNPKAKLAGLEEKILNTHALAGNLAASTKAKLGEGVKANIFKVTSGLNKLAGVEAAPAAAVKGAAPVVEGAEALDETTQAGGRRRRTRKVKHKRSTRKSRRKSKKSKRSRTKRSRTKRSKSRRSRR
jgi:hypothetical protein